MFCGLGYTVAKAKLYRGSQVCHPGEDKYRPTLMACPMGNIQPRSDLESRKLQEGWAHETHPRHVPWASQRAFSSSPFLEGPVSHFRVGIKNPVPLVCCHQPLSFQLWLEVSPFIYFSQVQLGSLTLWS